MLLTKLFLTILTLISDDIFTSPSSTTSKVIVASPGLIGVITPSLPIVNTSSFDEEYNTVLIVDDASKLYFTVADSPLMIVSLLFEASYSQTPLIFICFSSSINILLITSISNTLVKPENVSVIVIVE